MTLEYLEDVLCTGFIFDMYLTYSLFTFPVCDSYKQLMGNERRGFYLHGY